MIVDLVLKGWKITQDKATKLPKIVGAYGIAVGEKEIATQDFNEGYACKEVSFSAELLLEVQAVEAKIKAELQRLLT